jgi:propionyl-CoA synthetase
MEAALHEPRMLVRCSGAAMDDAAPTRHASLCRLSADPVAWWAGVADGISWERRWDRAFDPASGPYGRWFPGAILNTCFNCIDRHVLAGRGEQAALIWDSPMTGRVETFTYRQMQSRTAKLAGALAALGVAKGDRVVITCRWCPRRRPYAGSARGSRHPALQSCGRRSRTARIADAKPKVIVCIVRLEPAGW